MSITTTTAFRLAPTRPDNRHCPSNGKKLTLEIEKFASKSAASRTVSERQEWKETGFEGLSSSVLPLAFFHKDK